MLTVKICGYVDIFEFEIREKFRRFSVKMVNVMKGVLVTCDGPMKQFLLHLDETMKLGRKFIIQDLDDNHLFISVDILEELQSKVDDLMDQTSIPVEKSQ